MCGEYDKSRFTQILINRNTKTRLDGIKEVIASHTKENSHSGNKKKKVNRVSYNNTIVALLDNVQVTSGGHTLLLVK